MRFAWCGVGNVGLLMASKDQGRNADGTNRVGLIQVRWLECAYSILERWSRLLVGADKTRQHSDATASACGNSVLMRD